MKYILAISLVVILVACSSGENHDQFAIGWRTNGITASIVRDDQSLGLGQYLILVHDLEPGEAGRLSKIIDISESWTIREIEVIDGIVRLETENSGIFEVSLENLGELMYEIYIGSGDQKADWVLQDIWFRHAGLAS